MAVGNWRPPTDTVAGNVDYFLKIEGIEGESQDDKHKGEIDVETWSWGLSQMGAGHAGGGSGAGKAAFQDFTFHARMSKASPKLMLACATGQHFKKAVLTCRKAGGSQQEYLVVTLTDCLVSSYQTGGSPDELLPPDSFSLNYAKVEEKYQTQDDKGAVGKPVTVGYDVKANQKV